MKTLATGALASALCLAIGTSAPRSHAGEPDAPARRTFTFVYEAKFPRPAEGAARLDAWVPLPAVDDLQEVADLRVAATLDGKDVAVAQHADAAYGNRMAHVGLDKPTGELAIRWSARITRATDVGQGKGPTNPRFLEADRLLPIDGKAAALAKELGVAGSGDVLARGRTIYEHVLSTMQYDKDTPGWGKGDFDRACDVGKGNCTDFHAKFIGIGRAAGIPVRFTMGIPITTEPKGKAGGYHCWAHFFDGRTWIPVDISEAQKVVAKDPAKAQWFFGHLDPDRLTLSVGRDLTLTPAQKGAPLLFFAYPYCEVDGKAVDVPKENRSFTWDS